jgi:hypothetical protein
MVLPGFTDTSTFVLGIKWNYGEKNKRINR